MHLPEWVKNLNVEDIQYRIFGGPQGALEQYCTGGSGSVSGSWLGYGSWQNKAYMSCW